MGLVSHLAHPVKTIDYEKKLKYTLLWKAAVWSVFFLMALLVLLLLLDL